MANEKTNTQNEKAPKAIDHMVNDEDDIVTLLSADGEEIDFVETLKTAQKEGQSSKIKLRYFTVTFYKKGTCHIEFTNEELLHKFNLFGSMRKGWLPPVYGKVKYKDMTEEEKSSINEFEGETSYNKVMSNKDYYIVENSKLLMLQEAI